MCSIVKLITVLFVATATYGLPVKNRGVCSYYGSEVGRNAPTASGEIFDW